MNIKNAISKLVLKQDLSSEEMSAIVHDIMSGNTTPTQIGGFLVALRMKKETIDEITAAATVMRQLALPISIPEKNILDIVGTGGDQSNTFNVSTVAAFIASAAGITIAKHCNRALSSHCGSVDILEALGVKVDLEPEKMAHCIQKIGIGFLLAPKYHKATQYVQTSRKELGIRTLFNLLGPLTNPAHPKNHLIGIYDAQYLTDCANVLKQLGSKHALIVNSKDGLDEISISNETQVAELKNGEIITYSIKPEDYQLPRASLASIQTTSLEQSLQLFQQVLNNVPGPTRDIAVLNAGASIYAADLVDNIGEGIEKAKQVLESGAAKNKLEALIQMSQQL